MRRTRPVMLIGMIMLFLLAVGITVAAFYSLIIPEDRGEAFQSGVAACCIAEFVILGYLGYTLGAGSSPDQPDSAIRLRSMLMFVFWGLIIITTSVIAAAPGNADTFFSDKIILLQTTITFFFLAAMFFQRHQAVAIGVQNSEPQGEVRRLESFGGGLDALLIDLRSLAERAPDHAIALDGLAKRMDTLRTQLRSCSPAQQRDGGRPIEIADGRSIEQLLSELHDEAAGLLSSSNERLPAQMQKTRSVVDRALAALRQREDGLTF